MSNERKITDAVLTKLLEGQNHLSEKIDQRLRETSAFPERVRIQFVTSLLAKNSLETDWKTLLANIENLLNTKDGDQLEIVYQDVLETLSNLICNQVLNPHLVTPFIGSRSRKYIEDYDSLMGSKTPGF